ncbi:MAG: hypothetical protein RLO52_04110 [Sandaracinaceae bacterium]
MMQWNDPKSTWRLASYMKVERRLTKEERRDDTRRAVIGERRAAKKNRRSIASLLRL